MDWNPIWELKTARFEGGWVAEIAVPFKSLRYRPGRAQIWGFNARRVNRWKNEVSYLTSIPASLTMRGHFQSSLMATLVGLEAPSGSRNLEVKPYGISQVVTDRTATPIVANDLRGDWGLDAKYGISQSVTADFTYNTDFAQVEADEQQVNLTRFSLFFPEKREFFLENQRTFAFGGGLGFGPAGGGGGGGRGAANANPSDTPLLFYSRRIGLNGGRAIPIQGGGRLTGRARGYSVGLLSIQAGDESVTNRLVGSRVTYTMTPLMFVSALVQYSSAGNVGSANVRLRWEYRPGSELFVVFNEQRDTLVRGFPALANRAFIIKVNRLFRL